jgi:hypothetical protein
VTIPFGGTPSQQEATDEPARDMIDVRGTEAAGVGRANARATACSGRPNEARTWIRVVDLIQRRARRDAAGAAETVDPT